MGVALKLVRRHFFQLLFHIQHSFAWRQSGAVADAEEMGIDGNGGHPEGDIEDDVGGFAPNTRQAFQHLPVGRHVTAMLVDQHLMQWTAPTRRHRSVPKWWFI